MSDDQASASAETTAKLFRGRILKPEEGVFLFHLRAMQRLITEHLSSRVPDISIPDLAYYLMPSEAFLVGLETENPEALAVIEGLNLPSYVILLPIPPEQRLDQVGFIRLLRDYWARRFEGEVARAWQVARDDNQDLDAFGAPGLRRLIGELAFAEIRDILTRDGVIPGGVEDHEVCRACVALVARLRYFSPGVRGFFFPAIRDWQALDHWLIESGLDLPSVLHGGRLPRLLERSRPDRRCGEPANLLLLPSGLPYGRSDPDFARADAAIRAVAAPSSAHLADPETTSSSAADPNDPVLDRLDRRCLEQLDPTSCKASSGWRASLRDDAVALVAPVFEALLALPRRMVPGRLEAWLRGAVLELHLLMFERAIRQARCGERRQRFADVLIRLGVARQRMRAIRELRPSRAPAVETVLDERAAAAETALTEAIAADAGLAPEVTDELRVLVQRLGAEVARTASASGAQMLLHDLQRVLLEGRTTYYRLRPWRWLTSYGTTGLRQILPFQARLKALRALDSAQGRFDQLGWSTLDIERFTWPLRELSAHLATQLAEQLRPRLRTTLEEAGFTPSNHLERVAAHKMREELLDIIQRRRHLKFTDVRDVVARNILRLPDPTLDELRQGDRLAQFDRVAARELPGVYQPGELYIKGLQQLGAPLFGTPRGRLVLRYLIVPFGLAFLGLKTIDLILGLVLPDDLTPHLTRLWLVLALGTLINGLANTRIGRWLATTTWRATWWTLRLLFYDGLRRLMRWGPVARLLATNLIRGLDRNLVQPLFIGVLMVLPFFFVGRLIEGLDIEIGLSFFVVAFALGTLLRNTPAGRRLLDNAVSAMRQFLRRVNQTLVIGLIRELLHFFKEVTRRFEQGLHRIEEVLSHQLGESRWQLALKSVFVPVWKLLESIIQFYVTVLVEPQINPIKHFPLVTIAHKLMLPFLPALTGLMVAVTEPFLPKLIAYPFVTLTILLLPGLAGFLVWELKENWKIYAANHAGSGLVAQTTGKIEAVHRVDLEWLPVEPAMIGSHGETMRGMLRRGFHSGTLPKAFDRLRRVLREQIRDEIPYPQRLRDAQRRLAEVDHALCVFCARELGYALRRRAMQPDCGLVRVETGRPRLSSNAFELTMALFGAKTAEDRPIELRLCIYLEEPDVYLRVEVAGPKDDLGEPCWDLIRADIAVFAGRAAAKQAAPAV